MARRALSKCAEPTCTRLVRGARCDRHAAEQRKERQQRIDRRRGSAASRGYGSEWRRERAAFLIENPLCTVCAENGFVTAATVVDHIIPHNGPSDPLFWDRSNWQPLCKDDHDRKTLLQDARPVAIIPDWLEPSRIPVTIVCGPPGSGKSTWVAERAGPSDLIVDLDEIKSQLSGLPWYRAGPEWVVPALRERNRILGQLSKETRFAAAWLIVSAPEFHERERWRAALGAQRIVVLAANPWECERRLAADGRRADQAWRYAELARYWWQRYSAGHDEEVIRDDA